MQPKNSLRLERVHGDKPHAGPACRFANGGRVGWIVFVALAIGFDELRGNQFGGVPKPGQTPRPIVAAAAGFHGDDARVAFAKERHRLFPPQRLLDHDLAMPVHAVHRKYLLCQIHANCRNLPLGLLAFGGG
jgi:hypothetical protein